MELAELLIILLGSLAVTAFARWRGLPAPLLVVGVALAVSFVPGLPEIEIDGELILTVVLPPLLYSASLDVSLQSFRASRGSIVRLGIGAVLVTAFVVGGVAYLLVPDLSLPAAILLGAVVAPPDAVSAAAIGRRLGLPRKVMTVLSGESLINDAASLTLVKVFLAVVGGASLTVWDDLGVFGLAIGVGVGVGLLLGVVVHQVRLRVDDPVVETVVGLLLPFVAYVLGEELHGSGVLAVVSAGLYVGFRSPRTGYATRLQERPFWTAADVLLEGFVFALIGLQLRTVVEDVAASGRDLGQSIGTAFVVLAVVVLVRPVFVYASYGGARVLRYLLLSPVLRRHRGARWLRRVRYHPQARLDVRQLAVISWTGMRGVVTLAAVVTIPTVTESGAAVPARDVMFLIAFVVTVGTLLLQGLTLPLVIRWLGVQDTGQKERDLAAQLRVFSLSTEETVRFVDERRPAWEKAFGRDVTERAVATTVARLRRQEEVLKQGALDAEEGADDPDRRDDPRPDWDPAGGPGAGPAAGPAERGDAGEAGTPAERARRRRRAEPRAHQQIRRELLARRREVVLRERDAGAVDEEVMRQVLLGLDAEELAMDTNALSGFRS
ncbi:cation:proton antiporter [Frigoribacterium salinisoli]